WPAPACSMRSMIATMSGSQACGPDGESFGVWLINYSNSPRLYCASYTVMTRGQKSRAADDTDGKPTSEGRLPPPGTVDRPDRGDQFAESSPARWDPLWCVRCAPLA